MPNELLEPYRQGWALPFRGEIWEYGRCLDLQNGYAVKGLFDIARSKYLMEPFRALRNQRIRQVVVIKAVQTGGSLLADVWVPYMIEHDPGDMLWLFQDDDFATRYMAERFLPLLRSTRSIKPWIDSAGRFGVQRDAIYLPHMSIMIGGLNEGNVQSLSKRVVIIDEAWMAKSNGLIRQAKDRTTAYPYTSKVLIISQAGVEGDDLDLEWAKSSMSEWQWQCPSCKRHQKFEWNAPRTDGTWAGMKWETNEFTRPAGRWNYPAVAKTARLECFHCGHQVEDTPTNRRLIDDTHCYAPSNPTADESILGFHWPAIANPDISFASLVVKYLQAKEQQEQHGYLLPLMEFYQKQLAVAWNLNAADDVRKVAEATFDLSADWPEEAHRFLTVDCQKDLKEFWWVVRAWSKSGESRQLGRGRAETWDEIAEIQSQYKVQDQKVFVDCNWETTAIAAECVRRGHVADVMGRKVWRCWIGLRGTRTASFLHRDPKSGVADKRIYSPLTWLDPSIGKSATRYKVPCYDWSNLHVKDILKRHRDGRAAKFLSLPDSDPPTDRFSYTAQMNSEIRVRETDDYGRKISVWKQLGSRPNHWWDCECMQIVAALIFGIIGGEQQGQD